MAAEDGPAGASSWLVLYDSDCGFCKWLLAVLLRWDRAGRLRPLAIQAAEAQRLLADLVPAERLASWHLVAPGGERRSAGAALPPLLRLLPAGRIAAAPLERAPAITDHAYRWVADNRSRLSAWVPAASKRRASERVSRREQ